MKSLKDLLKGVKEIFNADPNAAPAAPVADPAVAAPTNLSTKTYKLKDGVEISVAQAGDILAVGDTVTVGGVPATEGVHILEDGTSITVDASGVITLIVEPVPATTDLSNEPAPPTMEQRIATLEDTIKRLSTPAPVQMSADTPVIKELTEKFSAQITKHEETIKAMFELMEQIVETPSGDPATLTGEKKDKFERSEKRTDRISRIAEAIKNEKN